jgi:hypothetical protein
MGSGVGGGTGVGLAAASAGVGVGVLAGVFDGRVPYQYSTTMAAPKITMINTIAIVFFDFWSKAIPPHCK